jgi:hypothetical protein
MDGNFPCPRTEMALAYNPVLNRVLAYSGYTAGMPTLIRETMYQYAYFGDTFMWDPDTRVWKHVITRGFPSFRAQAHMFVDEATGKTYVFGGYTNRDFVSLSLLTGLDRRHSSHARYPRSTSRSARSMTSGNSQSTCLVACSTRMPCVPTKRRRVWDRGSAASHAVPWGVTGRSAAGRARARSCSAPRTA